MIKQIPSPENSTPLPPPPPPPPILAHASERETAKLAAGELGRGFSWYDLSAEGSKFWNGVYERLQQISRDGILKD